MKRKGDRNYRNIRLVMDVYEILRKQAKEHKVSMTGIVRFFITELELGRIKLDWGKVREAYPDTRGRVLKQWQGVELAMADVIREHQRKSERNFISIEWMVKQAVKAGLSDKQVHRWMKNQMDDGKAQYDPRKDKYFYVL